MSSSTTPREYLPVLPLPDVVIFPGSVSPLLVMRPQSLAAVEHSMAHDSRIFLVTQRAVGPDPLSPEDLYEVGTVCQILQFQRMHDGSVKAFVEGVQVSRAMRYELQDKMLGALVEPLEFIVRSNKRLDALRRTVLRQFETYARLSERIPEDLFMGVRSIEDPIQLTYAIANYVPFKTPDKQALLEIPGAAEKFLYLSEIFTSENELLAMENKILGQVKSQIGKNQKEYFLNEQLKVIEKELGLGSEEDVELEELQKAVDDSKMSEEARDKAQRELNRLARMAPMSPESTVARTYIEWLLDYPWDEHTKDCVDLRRAARVLDEDHFGLHKVKERILEFLAVHRLVKGSMAGSILCLVGPPGVGKTSLARSVARTLNRKFARFSLGGVRDEAEIRGHRRTYVGAMPGKIVQLMKKAGSRNPVLLLDEIDKMNADFRGDPASALLEVLDPEQNHTFNDHYMEVDLDLSQVMFITTANTTDGIPWALRDRMEILRLPGYTRDEKLQIALRYLVPRQMEKNGILDRNVEITDESIQYIIDKYTREAGVRNLEREIAALCRKEARKIASTRSRKKIVLQPVRIRQHLGPVRYSDLEIQEQPEIGVTTGLAWTEVGGELLPVEAIVMEGDGKLKLTGKLGEVMRESAQAGLSYIRAHAAELKVAQDFHKTKDIHVHLPEGAIPKDGPSAGVTMITSMVSVLSGRPVRQDIAMTGEITLRGKVLKIGGLKEKVIAAHRAHIHTVIIPAENKDDLADIAPEIRAEMTFVPVRMIDEVLKRALVPGKAEKAPKAVGSNRRAKRPPAPPVAV